MKNLFGLGVIFIATLYIVPASCFLEGMYCGLENCYELLAVTREDKRSVITKAYRQLARKWHPDRHRGDEAKETASAMFQKIANAYEILKDEEQRDEYNYMLDNPDEFYYNYYKYYKRHYAPKVDVRLVIAVTLTVISVFQYWNSWNNYNTAINYLVTIPKYRIQATEIAKQEGLLDSSGHRKKDRNKTKDEIREEEETILKLVLQEKMDVRGSYSKPSITQLLWIQLILSPYYLIMYIVWLIRWVWKFGILRHDYGEEEKFYLMRKNLKLSQSAWDSLEDDQKDDYVRLELWKKDKFIPWKQEQEEKSKRKMAESGKYKSYRRWMKQGGPGRMTFEDD